MSMGYIEPFQSMRWERRVNLIFFFGGGGRMRKETKILTYVFLAPKGGHAALNTCKLLPQSIKTFDIFIYQCKNI